MGQMDGTLLHTTCDGRLYLLSTGDAYDELYGYCINEPLVEQDTSIAEQLELATKEHKLRRDTPSFDGGRHDYIYRFICPDLGQPFEGERVISSTFFKIIDLDVYLRSPTTSVYCGVIVKGRRLFSIQEIEQRRRTKEWLLRLPFPPHIVYGNLTAGKAAVFSLMPNPDDFDLTNSEEGIRSVTRIVAGLKKLGRAISILRFHPISVLRLAVRAHYANVNIPSELEERITVTLMKLEGRRFEEVTEVGTQLMLAKPKARALSLERIGRLTFTQMLKRVVKTVLGLAQVDKHYIELKRQCDLVGADIIVICYLLLRFAVPENEQPTQDSPPFDFHGDLKFKIGAIQAVVTDQKGGVKES